MQFLPFPRSLSKVVALFAAAALPLGSAFSATLVWQENFDGIAPSAGITTANSNFQGSNLSNGSITAAASTTGTGSSMRITGATTGGTSSGAWAGAGGSAGTSFGALTSMSVAFSLNVANLDSGTFAFYMGNGNTVANNYTNYNVNADHVLWSLVINSTGNLQYLNSASTYVNTGIVIQENTAYQLLIQVNATASAIDGLAANSMSIYLNGELAASGLGLRSGTANANGFRVGGRNTTAAGDLVVELDDIRIWNGIQAVPESSASALVIAGAALLATRRRRTGSGLRGIE